MARRPGPPRERQGAVAATADGCRWQEHVITCRGAPSGNVEDNRPDRQGAVMLCFSFIIFCRLHSGAGVRIGEGAKPGPQYRPGSFRPPPAAAVESLAVC